MKRLTVLALLWTLFAGAAHASDSAISALTASRAPSTNTFVPAADMSTTNNYKLLLGDLPRQAFDGSAAWPSFGFASQTNTGVYLSAPGLLGFTVVGTERWDINSSGALVPAANNVSDIGNGVNNPRDISWTRNGTGGSLQITNTVTASNLVATAGATLANPAIADFSNSQHGHLGASSGGTLTEASLANRGTTHTVLHGNAAGSPAFSAVDLASADVTGVLPAANFAQRTFIDPTQPPYNAPMDGTSDATSAFQAALNAGKFIVIPAGTFVIDCIYPTNGTRMVGAGSSTVLLKKPGTTNWIINAGTTAATATNAYIIEDLSLDGAGVSTNMAGVTTPGLVNGAFLYSDVLAGPAAAVRCSIQNFSGKGVFLDGVNDINSRRQMGFLAFNTITNCQTGIWLSDTNRAEYTRVEGNRVWKCYWGIYNPCANVTVVGNDLSDAGSAGWYAKSATLRSHSLYIGNTVNHMGVTFYNAFTGANVVGNNMLGSSGIAALSDASGSLYSQGISIRANYFEQPAFSFYASSNNVIEGNTFRTSYTLGGSGVAPLLRNNLYAETMLTVPENEVTTGATSGSLTVDFRFPRLSITCSGDPTFSATANRAATRKLTVIVDPNGSTRNLAFNASWKWFTATPTTIASGKKGRLTLECRGTAETDVEAVWEVEQ